MGLWVVLLLWGASASCPQWRCRPLSTGVCAEWTPAFVWVNVEPCPEGLTCSMLDLVPQQLWTPSGTLRCSAPFLPHNSSALNCLSRNELNSLVTPHPQHCDSDQDCKLLSSGSGRCACGSDGTSYCKLSEGDEELTGFYERCGTMSGTEAFSWYLLIDLGHMLRRMPWCARAHFEEFEDVQRLLTARNINNFL